MVVWSTVFILSWLLPNHYPPWVNFHSEFLAFTALTILFCYIFFINKVKPSIPFGAILLFLVAFIPIAQYSIGLVLFAGDSFVSTYYILALILAFVTSYSTQTSNSVDRSKFPASISSSIFLSIFIAALASSILGIFQWIGIGKNFEFYLMPIEPGGRVTANLGQPNQLATLLTMGFVSTAFLFERKKLTWFVALPVAFVITWSLVLTQSRIGIVGALACIIFLVSKRRRKGVQSMASFFLLWFFFVIAAVLSLPHINQAALLEQGRQISFIDGNGRILIWQQSLAAISSSPWIGYGWNQSSVAQFSGATQYSGDLFISNAHNIFLDLILWTGVPVGLFLIFAILYWFLSRIWHIESDIAVYAMACLIPFALHSLVEFPFAYAYFLITAGLLIGLVESSVTQTISFDGIRFLFLKVVFFVMVLCGLYGSHEYLFIEEDYRVARFESIKMGNTPVWYVRPTVLVNTQLAALIAALRQKAAPDMKPQEIENLRKVSLRFGARSILFKYAIALALNDRGEESSRAIKSMRNVFGEQFYRGARAEWLKKSIEYPQLNKISFP
jgi:O-antigen ligase